MDFMIPILYGIVHGYSTVLFTVLVANIVEQLVGDRRECRGGFNIERYTTVYRGKGAV